MYLTWQEFYINIGNQRRLHCLRNYLHGHELQVLILKLKINLFILLKTIMGAFKPSTFSRTLIKYGAFRGTLSRFRLIDLQMISGVPAQS